MTCKYCNSRTYTESDVCGVCGVDISNGVTPEYTRSTFKYDDVPAPVPEAPIPEAPSPRFKIAALEDVKRKQDDRVVALLEQALTDARAGKIHGVVVVGVGEARVGSSFAGKNLITAIGEMESVKLKILVQLMTKVEG